MKKTSPTVSPSLRFGFPKGSLQDSTFRLFKKAGYNVSVGSRAYVPTVDDPDITGLLIRSQEMARYVEDQVLDAGICGRDWVLENNADITEVCELKYSKQTNKPIRWVVAVPNDSSIQSIKQLHGKRIATELVKYTERYLKKQGVKAIVEFSWGATEVKPPVLADAIVELTETGSSLRANNLRIVATILESVTVLIANKAAMKDPWKRQKLENIGMLLQGAIIAEEKVGLKMNVPRKSVDAVLAKLPAMNAPTISNLTNDSWVSIEVILDEKTVRDIIPNLKVLASAALAAFFGVLLLRSSRNRVYFMMLTLALSQVLWALAFQWRSLTHGDDGLTGIPRPFIGSLPLTDSAHFYWFTAVIFVVAAAILLAIVHSPFGLTLKGMRESPSRMSALGYDVWLHRYITFIIAGTFAGLAGALLVFQNGIASPGQFSVATSAEALLMVILGGAGTMLGPALGSMIVVLLEFLVSEQTERWMSVLGVIYILVVLGAPGGVFPLLRTAARKLLREHTRAAASERT